jgi:aldose 1-epimerase
MAGLVTLLAASVASAEPGLTRKPFGKTAAGQPVDLFVLTNANGLQAAITNYGAIVTSLTAPDRAGKLADVVLGFDTLDGYLGNHPYFGAICGRYANRIAQGTFTLDGRKYTLARNNGDNHLHGGLKGFDKVVWQAQEVRGDGGPALKLTYVSKDGEEGYPGTLTVTVTYALTDKNELRIDYHATTDKPTPVNLTQHSYFNLAGQGNGDILGHELLIHADRFTPVDAGLIPTGERRRVEGTPLDFRKPVAIGARINQDDEQLRFGRGYDHNWVLNKKGAELSLAARAYEPTTGRVLEVSTTEPGMQFYCGNFLDGSNVGKGGKVYKHRFGFCLETQHFPDSPNKPDFPSTILRPGEEYRTTTVYKFSAQ